MHDEEATWDLSLGLRSRSISDGRVPDVLVKESAERSETLKSDFEADVGHAKFVAEQFFRLLDAALNQVLMRGLVECLPEQTKKMVAREAGLLGNLFEAERMVIAVVDKIARATKPL